MIIGHKQLTLNEIEDILFSGHQIELAPATIQLVNDSYDFLSEFSKDKVIYGINTGFGPMAQYRIADEERIELQYNLIRSHCAGSGHPFSEIECKSILISRLNTLLLGYSGIHPNAVALMVQLVNLGIYPVIYTHGGVGASGDLVQLAHLALALIGEGEVWWHGNIRSAKDVFTENNITPLSVYLREGLALMNGTSAMTGIGILNLIYAKKLIRLSTILSSLINELLGAYEDHFSLALNHAKLHTGQQKIAADMIEILLGSGMIKQRKEHLYNGKLTQEIFEEKVQEYYSIRCVPQIIGAIADTIDYSENVVINELNSANDNPIIDLATKNVYHGGNFHGDYVSFEMDKVKIAITKLSMLMERQLNYLLNDKLNGKLTPFINLGKLGFNFGIQGMQFTATSTVAENQSLSFPNYVHSIPNNNDNQDIVSMGTNSASIASTVIENTFEVCSIHLIAVLQAIDLLNIENKMSSFNRKFYAECRSFIPKITTDIPTFKILKDTKNFLKNSNF